MWLRRRQPVKQSAGLCSRVSSVARVKCCPIGPEGPLTPTKSHYDNRKGRKPGTEGVSLSPSRQREMVTLRCLADSPATPVRPLQPPLPVPAPHPRRTQEGRSRSWLEGCLPGQVRGGAWTRHQVASGPGGSGLWAGNAAGAPRGIFVFSSLRLFLPFFIPAAFQ